MPRFEFETFVAGPDVPEAFAALNDAAAPPEPLAPGTTCAVAYEQGLSVARCSLGTRTDLHGAAGSSGWIGHYRARTPETGAALLGEVATRLAREGAVRVLGPMNGTTWARYRFALEPEPSDVKPAPAPFPGEPVNPPEYPRHFTHAGFGVAARYESRLDDLAVDADDVAQVTQRVAAAGFSLRPLDVTRFDAELDVLFRLSLEAFADNLYYAPIDAAAFRAMYEPFRGHIDPEFVLIGLDRQEQPCGYLFGYPDALGSTPEARRMVCKTVAVLPRARGHGLANHMLDRLRWSARQRGFHQLVHALMHVENFSTRMSARNGGRIFRRYALYQWLP